MARRKRQPRARRNTSPSHRTIQITRRRARSIHRSGVRRRDGGKAIDRVDVLEGARGAGGGHGAEEDGWDDGCGEGCGGGAVDDGADEGVLDGRVGG